MTPKLNKPKLLGIEPRVIAGTKDYYETTMADTFIFVGDDGREATFNVATRGMREHKVVGREEIIKDGKKFVIYEVEKDNYLINCGQEQAIANIMNFEIGDDLIAFYERKGLAPETIENLKNDRKLNLDVYGIPEGIPVFGNEPLLSLTGSFERVQFPESLVIAPISYETAVATTASYIKNILKEFGREDIITLEGGSRRFPLPLLASRAALIGGFNGTSLEQIAIEYLDLESRVGGSASHSSVIHSGGDEVAFENQIKAYYRIREGDSQETIEIKIREVESRAAGPTFLIDTFDSTMGLESAIKMINKYHLKKATVRTDSGDPLERTRYIRKRLDEVRLNKAKIMVSDDLTAAKIYYLLENKAPIDIILIGTYLVNPYELPGPVLKDARDEQRNGQVINVCKIVKNNPSKATLPGVLDVYRIISKSDGKADRDVILMRDVDNIKDFMTSEDQEALKLTVQFLDKGEQVYNFPSPSELDKTREKFLGLMRPEYLKFKGAKEYKVIVSPTVEAAKNTYYEQAFGAGLTSGVKEVKI